MDNHADKTSSEQTRYAFLLPIISGSVARLVQRCHSIRADVDRMDETQNRRFALPLKFKFWFIRSKHSSRRLEIRADGFAGS
jgi:hypothetical protein